MKGLFIALGLTTALLFGSCKENASSKVNTANVEVAAERDLQAKKLPVMKFDKSEHDFGTIAQGTPQELSLIHISEPTRLWSGSRMPSSA